MADPREPSSTAVEQVSGHGRRLPEIVMTSPTAPGVTHRREGLNHEIVVENCARSRSRAPCSALAQAPKKAVASPALQKEFDGFIAKFRAALKANDSAAVAGMTRLRS